MALYQILDLAQSDIEHIFNYTAEQNLKSAIRLFDKIHAACELLSQFPLMGYRRPNLSHHFYFWPIKRYVIIYTPEKPIKIIRVLNAYRNISDFI